MSFRCMGGCGALLNKPGVYCEVCEQWRGLAAERGRLWNPVVPSAAQRALYDLLASLTTEAEQATRDGRIRPTGDPGTAERTAGCRSGPGRRRERLSGTVGHRGTGRDHPAPPDAAIARLLADWWHGHRHFGCRTARDGDQWVVVMPNPSIWCPSCALPVFEDERRCAYCHGKVRPRRSHALMFEMSGVRVLGRAHPHCADAARKETR